MIRRQRDLWGQERAAGQRPRRLHRAVRRHVEQAEVELFLQRQAERRAGRIDSTR